MSWCNDAPPRFSLHYDLPRPGRARAEAVQRRLLADTLDDAKLEAAILYASFDLSTAPSAYRIVRGARSVVYCYPEPKAPRPDGPWLAA